MTPDARRCARPGCGHAEMAHFYPEGGCANCACHAFVAPPEQVAATRACARCGFMPAYARPAPAPSPEPSALREAAAALANDVLAFCVGSGLAALLGAARVAIPTEIERIDRVKDAAHALIDKACALRAALGEGER